MSILRGRASTKLLLETTNALHAPIDAGIPIIDSLNIIADATSSKDMCETLNGIADEIQHGASLGDALEPFQGYLGDEFTLGMSVGGDSGRIPDAIKALSEIFDYRLKLTRSIIRQLTYPAFVMFAGIVIIPYIKGLFLSDESAGDFTIMFFYGFRYPVFIFICGWIGYIIVGGSPQLRRKAIFALSHTWPMKTPLRRMALARFFDGLGLLLASGQPYSQAIDRAIIFTSNLRLERELEPIVALVLNGTPLHKALSTTGIVDQEMINYIKTAETTGTVDEGLHKVAVYITTGTQFKLDLWVSLIGTFAILIIGFFVLKGLIPQ